MRIAGVNRRARGMYDLVLCAALTAVVSGCGGDTSGASQTASGTGAMAQGVPVAAPPNPTVSLSASPGTVSSGSGSMLSWSSTNATSCSASGGWSGSEPTSGSASTGPLSATATFTLTCNGASGTTPATQSTTVTVQSGGGGGLTITSATTLPNATNGGGYFYQLQASGGTPPYLWSLSSKSGATDWVVTPGGWIEGAPTSNENDSIVATVTDAASHSAQKTFAVTVNSTLAVMNQNFLKGGVTPPAAMAGAAYSHVLQAAGGMSPYSWSIASGSLPAGLTLSSAGVITGTPSGAGNSGVVLRVTDNTNATATANATLVVAPSGRVARPSYNTGSGFFALNGQLYDPNGYPFHVRGTNRVHFDQGTDVQALANAHINAVRYGMFHINTAPTTPDAATYESGALTQHIANDQFVIMANFYTTPADGNLETTGTTNATQLNDIVSWWVSNEATFAPIMNQMAIEIANEWGPANSTAWRDAYISAIGRLRAAGYTCPIVIDSGGWGQDPYDFLNYGQAVFNSDPQKNVILALHLYSAYYDSLAGVAQTYNNQHDLQPITDSLAALGVPIIYEEFGPGRNLGGSVATLTTPARIIQVAEGAGFGWMMWGWDEPNLANCMANNSSMSLTYNCGRYSVPSDLTEYGLDMALNPAYGWDALASPASVFLP
jgi:hypothetical protein